MIQDKVCNFEKYVGVHPEFETVYRFLQKTDLTSLSPGRIDISDNVYVNVVETTSKTAEEMSFEFHKVYFDIHVMIEGKEWIEFADMSSCDVEKEYQVADDYGLCHGNATTIAFEGGGAFTICFPEELHKPLCDCKSGLAIRKCIFKVKA